MAPYKVGFTCGAFDLCHAGHVLMFEECKQVCEYLIVGLQSDPSLDRSTKNKPIMSLEERFTILRGIRYVDEVVVYHTEAALYELLKNYSAVIQVRIIGADWRGQPYTGHDLSIPIHFNTRDHGYSTSELRRRVFHAERARIQDL
ncbi:MAG: adenylyltransferase/cytidyltransferase family protein [Candidatus Pacebacteria bacterium]|nr:adenylyltransferase/cytidyltransferase family protein [Candidatus Paceibacterota bacterium]